jgi:hypothetical protein
MMIVNDDSRVINKLEASLLDDARVIIYNRHVFIVQATACAMTLWKMTPTILTISTTIKIQQSA